ncbi:MAG: ABC transporter permease [Ilumatobacteraceae bacterium]|nr:ABC transporter permease [Ilumatobacteraceae bacterium]
MRRLLILTASDLRQRIRDRSVLIFALAVPLALMFVFNLVFGDTDELELRAVAVAVGSSTDDEMAPVVVDAIRSLDGEGFDVTVSDLPVSVARERIDTGEADVAILLPDGFGRAVQTGASVTVEALRGGSAELETDIVLSVVDGVLDRSHAGAVAAGAAAAEGVPPEQVGRLAEQAAAGGPAYDLVEGEAASEQLDSGAALVAGQAGLFLLFTVGFGVTGLLIEKENGTLSRLRSMPIPQWFIVAGKALMSLILGVISTSVLLTAGGWLFDADFGSPLPVFVLVVCATAAGVSVMFLVVRIARTSEQAGVATAIVALVLGIGGGAFIPVSATGTLATILDLNPVAALLRGLGITSAGGGIADLGVPIAIMLGFAAVTIGLSRLVPDRGALS